MPIPLEPDARQRAEIARQVFDFIERWHVAAPTMPASAPGLTDEQLQNFIVDPSEKGKPVDEVLADLDLAGKAGIYHPSGGHMSYIPNAGLFAGELGEFLAAALNRYTGVTGAAPGMTALENGITDWIASLFDLGDAAASILLSGGSMANMTAIVAARVNRLDDRFDDGILYVTEHTHHSVAKSARLAGFRNDQIRQVPVDDDLRMNPEELDRLINEDRSSGHRPFLVVASAGTTDTGTVDDLRANTLQSHGSRTLLLAGL